MKKFFVRYSYDFVKFFLNQFAIAIFGFSLALTAMRMGGKDSAFLWIFSVAAIIFYLCLTYGTAWKIGYSDRSALRTGEVKPLSVRGALISLCANSINIVLAVVVMIEALVGQAGATLARGVAILLQAEYQGVLAYFEIGGQPLNEYWWMYFLIIVPAVLVSWIAYIAGTKDFHIMNTMSPEYPASDRPTRAELREKRKNDKEK